MYLTRIRTHAIKLLGDVDLSLMEDGSPRSWTVLIGENGSCKSTLLQSIALAAAGGSLVEKLADANRLPDRRCPDEEAWISAEFAFSLERHRVRSYPGFNTRPEYPPRLRSDVRIRTGSASFETSSGYEGSSDVIPEEDDPLSTARSQNVNDWFVAGYGMFRTLPAPYSGRLPDNPAHSRLRSLFEPVPLIATGFADILAAFGDQRSRSYASALKKVLVQSGLLPGMSDLELRGQGGITSAATLTEANRFHQSLPEQNLKLPAQALSHGYQSTIAWVADLLGHVFLEAGGEVDSSAMEGLVLIDELDLHLHPQWQTSLVQTLKEVFPKLQFVATTHSPMVLPALQRSEVYVMTPQPDGSFLPKCADTSPALLTGSALYSRFFGLGELHPADAGKNLQEYGRLIGDPCRTDSDEERMQTLRRELQQADADPGWDPVDREVAPKEQS